MSPSPFDGLKPEILWNHFEAITKIPHCSGNEAGVAAYVSGWARDKGFEVRQDDSGNLAVCIPATAGKEGAPAIVLQGHLDMVGEKDSDSPHDFDKDPIPVIRDGDYLTADGTTLGADNCVGLAAGMALGDDPDAIHGPIELLFTSDEETGLTGAQGLKAGFVSGKTMLNLDSEEEGAVYVGCAGGVDTVVTLPVTRQEGSGAALDIRVSGLKGGHSGLDINLGRGNAIQVMAWLLDRLSSNTAAELTAFTAGDKHNAIPREARATILLHDGGRKVADDVLAGIRTDMSAIYGKTDPGLTIEISDGEAGGRPLSEESTSELLDMLLAAPHGVQAMSQDVEGLVETSTNLAVVKLGEDTCLVEHSSRSSVMPSIDLVQGVIFASARLAGAEPVSRGGYPGWQPNMDSAVLKKGMQVHERLFGAAPEVKAIHAGLECGIIGEKFGGMDMLSFGPQIEWPHSPSERIKIDTVDSFYSFLKALLTDLAA